MRIILLYAGEKVEAEEALKGRKNSISFGVATVFGMFPRMRVDLLVNDFTYRGVNEKAVVLSESHFYRNFIHVKDVCNVFLNAIENFETIKSQICNVGLSGANLSKKSFARK